MLSKVLAMLMLAPVAVVAGPIDENIPEPWFKNGEIPARDECVAGIDTELEVAGTPNLTLQCDEVVDGFVGIMQGFAADNYLGQRLRFSALVKSEEIEEGWGGLWMRVDDHDRRSSAFDNMQDRAIEGTTDWSRYEVVLDVSENASGIFFGTLMLGRGQLWVAELKLEPVGDDTPTTDRQEALEPGNLDLER